MCLFSPSLHPTSAEPPSIPNLHPPPWFYPCVLYSSSCNPLSPLSPPHSPLAIVRLFLTSMSLVIFCLLFSLVDYVPVKGKIIWYLSLTAWLIKNIEHFTNLRVIRAQQPCWSSLYCSNFGICAAKVSTHWLILTCAVTENQTCNIGVSGQHSTWTTQPGPLTPL